MRLVLVLCLLFPACAARQSIPIAAGADIVTTEMVLARGGYEANPVLQDTGTRMAVKVGLTVGLVWLSEWLESHGRLGASRGVQWLVTGLWAGASAWNVSQLSRSQTNGE